MGTTAAGTNMTAVDTDTTAVLTDTAEAETSMDTKTAAAVDTEVWR